MSPPSHGALIPSPPYRCCVTYLPPLRFFSLLLPPFLLLQAAARPPPRLLPLLLPPPPPLRRREAACFGRSRVRPSITRPLPSVCSILRSRLARRKGSRPMRRRYEDEAEVGAGWGWRWESMKPREDPWPLVSVDVIHGFFFLLLLLLT